MIRYAPAVSSMPSAIFVAVAGSLPRRRSHVHSPTSSGVNSRMKVGFTDWKISGEMLVFVASRAQNVSVKPFCSKAIQKITTTPKIKQQRSDPVLLLLLRQCHSGVVACRARSAALISPSATTLRKKMNTPSAITMPIPAAPNA